MVTEDSNFIESNKDTSPLIKKISDYKNHVRSSGSSDTKFEVKQNLIEFMRKIKRTLTNDTRKYYDEVKNFSRTFLENYMEFFEKNLLGSLRTIS